MHAYPAMMIPQVARTILKKYGQDAKTLLDPYCGTGTSLVEANISGIEAIGTDLNPLARLIAEVKTKVIDLEKIDGELLKYQHYLDPANENELQNVIPKNIDVNFWFTKDAIKQLGTIKIYINKIENQKVKNFFKVAFSETVRECSLTRNGEFKLYRIEKEKIGQVKVNGFETMINKLWRNRRGLKEFIELKNNQSETHIYDFNTVERDFFDLIKENSIDIVVTSPPYGDSHTTVAYGQYSRLSAEWLDLPEPGKVDSKLMGSKKKYLRNKSELLDECISKVKYIDEKRGREVESFYADYYDSICNISTRIKEYGFACFVVGNRRVKKVQLPTDEITKEFFEKQGFVHIETIIRNIPNKRMPSRNSPTNIEGQTESTMNNEYIVIMKKSKISSFSSASPAEGNLIT